MVFKSLVNNIALLITLSILYNLIAHQNFKPRVLKSILSGVLFGVISIAGMNNPFELAPGLIFDGRSIIISTAGLFGGPVVAVITMLISAAYRIYLGGPGAVMGVSVITSAGVIGIIYYYLRRKFPHLTRIQHFWIFSILVHLCMLLLMYTLPSNLTRMALQQIGIYVLTLYPIGQVLICLLLLDQEIRQKSEQARIETEQRYRTLYETMPDGFSRADMQNRYIEFNPAFQKMTGYSASELLALKYTDLTPPQWYEMEKEIVEKQVMVRGYSNLYTKEIRRKDGVIVPVELIACLTRDEQGNPASVWAIVRDISERKLAEEKFQKAFLNNPSILLLSEAESGRVIEVNDTFLRTFGLSREYVIGKNAEELHLMPMEKRKSLLTILEEQSHIHTIEMNLPIWGNEPHAFLYSIEPIFVGQQHILLFSAQDITERRRAEETIRRQKEQLEEQNRKLQEQSEKLLRNQEKILQFNVELERQVAERTALLEATNRELEAFAYSVSHDLRAPLRSLNGFSQILMDDYGAKMEEGAITYLHRIRAASEKMTRLIEDLLKLSRVTSSDLTMETIDLSRIVEHFAREHEENHPEQPVEWTIQPDLKAHADLALVKIAFQNLLNNAVKFSVHSRPARIEFGCQQKNGQILFFVRDNGVGFDMAYVNKLFTPFQRLHSEKSFEGTGIGLALVARIIRRHGGTIFAEGVPEHGATFYFTLPEID